MPAAAARLSIVVASHNARTTVEDCLDSIRRQAGAEAEVLLVDNSTDGTGDVVRERFPELSVLRLPPSALIPDLWAAGIRASRGDIVAITTAHCVPSERWAEAMLEALAGRASAVGGAIDNDPGGSAVDWAVYLCRYAAYMPPVREGFVVEIAGDNAAYKRAAIDACRAAWSDGFWEAAVHTQLRRAGQRLWLAPAAVVCHKRSFDFAGFLRQRFVHGMRYGRDRCRETGVAVRGLRALASPLIPAILLFRIVRHVRNKQRHGKELARALPFLLAFLLAWATGELVGYVRGRAS
jgi:glycosyltransferase involved in cell wall biosynthesis